MPEAPESEERQQEDPKREAFKNKIIPVLISVYTNEWGGRNAANEIESEATMVANKVADYWEDEEVVPTRVKRDLTLDPEDENYYFKVREIFFQVVLSLQGTLERIESGETSQYSRPRETKIRGDLHVLVHALDLIKKYHLE